MRNISFSMTTDQILNQFKTVTRRLGWKFLKVGDVLQPIEKGQGLKKGEKVKRIGPPIRVVDVRREALMLLNYDHNYGPSEMRKEGFPNMMPEEFVDMFCDANLFEAVTRRGEWNEITRIEFEYLNDAAMRSKP